jgi:hypothetical protein
LNRNLANNRNKKKPMKELRNLIALLAAFGMAAAFTGCGDDDDNGGGGGGGGAPQPTQFAPTDPAVLTAANRIYTVTIPGQETATLRFANGQYTFTQGGVTEAGTFAAPEHPAANTWTINVTPTAGQADAEAGTLRLDFSAANAGSFTFTPTAAGGTVQNGTFSVANEQATTTGPTTTDGGQTGGNDLSGKRLQLTYQNGQGERFDFNGPTSGTFEGTAETVVYDYNSAQNRINITRASGPTYSIQLTPTAGSTTSGTATVLFAETAGGATETFQANYTLQ